MEMSWLVLGVMLVMCTTNTGAVQMKIKPKRASTPKNGRVEIMCDIEHPVTNCWFHVWYVDYNGIKTDSVTLMNFDKENGAGTFPRPRFYPLFKASYHGDGRGQCGVKLFDLKPGTYFVGCRVRSETSGWTYDYMALVVHNSIEVVVQNSTGSQTNDFDSSNKADFEMVNVKENEYSELINFSVNLTSNRECRFILPENGLLVAKGSDRDEKTDMHHKAKWLATESTVSVTLVDVTSGGPLWCLCRDNPQSDFTEFDVKVVTLLKAPRDTQATKLEKTNFTEGETLIATCVARYARPVAKIVWWLGGDVIRNNTDDDNVDDATMDIDTSDSKEPLNSESWPWRWPWNSKSIKQVLNHVLTLDDNGKLLICQVLHPGLNGGHQDFIISKITVDTARENLKSAGPAASLFHLGVLLMAGLVVVIAGVVIFCNGSSRDSASRDTSHTYRKYDNDYYEIIDETMFSHTIPEPPLPVRRTEARVGRLSVPREFAPPRPEEPDYIIPKSRKDILQTNRERNDGHYERVNENLFSNAIPAPPLPVRRTEARVGRLSVPRESAPPRPEEPDYIIPDAPDDSVNPDGYLRPLTRSNR